MGNGVKDGGTVPSVSDVSVQYREFVGMMVDEIAEV